MPSELNSERPEEAPFNVGDGIFDRRRGPITNNVEEFVPPENSNQNENPISRLAQNIPEWDIFLAFKHYF